MAETWLQLISGGESRLSSGVIDSDGTISVNDASKFPTLFNYLLTIWEDASYTTPSADPNMEIVLVTGATGNVLTVTRAQQGTVATRHANACFVGQYLLPVHLTNHEDAIDLNTYHTMTQVSKSATYTLTATDVVCLCTGTFTVTLPTAVGITGKTYYVKNVSSGVITLDGDGSETIDGETTQLLHQWDTAQVTSDGTNWVII